MTYVIIVVFILLLTISAITANTADDSLEVRREVERYNLNFKLKALRTEIDQEETEFRHKMSRHKGYGEEFLTQEHNRFIEEKKAEIQEAERKLEELKGEKHINE